jgi:ribosome-associated toxin RatA of RatAB toxin-antitoxin module
MPFVEVDEIMPASVDKVWEVVNDVEAYPRLMEHVRSLEVRERGPNYRHTAWEVDLKGCVMNWVEREDIDAERYHIDYHQIEGDLEQFEGYWQLEPLTPDTCRAVLTVQFNIGIPMLDEMLNPIAERAIRESSLKMLRSLGSEAASDAERKLSVQEVS